MLIKIIHLIAFIGVVLSSKSKLEWNIADPYKYNGFIYADSQVVVINPAIQIKITNNEEICNFFINDSDETNGTSSPFRAIVKSAHLGLGELELKSNVSLAEWKNKEITFSLVAEACHDPDSWSVPASVSIKVLDPPGPLWSKHRYSVQINKNAPIGTTIIKVTAYLPKWSGSENKICQYLIKSPNKAPFQIDGEGTIRVTENLMSVDNQYWTLIVVAEDCSLPIHRESQANVFVSTNRLCKFGWTGFYTLLKYKPASGIQYLGKNPKLQLCVDGDNDDSQQTVDNTIKNCIANKTLRLTTSVELKSKLVLSTDAVLSDLSDCKLDFQSLKLQREVCGVSDSYAIDLLSELNKQKTGVLLFPVQANIFPTISQMIANKFSFFFWMKKDQMTEATEEYIICQIDEVGSNIFSVSLKQCILRIQLKSYHNGNHREADDESIPTLWAFSIPQLCDSKWHQVALIASRASENPYLSELSVFIDGEMADYGATSPEVQFNAPMQSISSNMTDTFLGQCPKSENTEFKGLLAGVILTPGVRIKSSTPRCLTKCSERLYFNGMNRMNPGMSVSLNSEMQMIIINGHNIDEVSRLVKVIGFVNPSWNPKPGNRDLIVETEMSCGTKVFIVPAINLIIQIKPHKSKITYQDKVTFIKLFSAVTTILIPDSRQTNSETGTGVAVFANTTLEIAGSIQSTRPEPNDVSSMIAKCVVTMHPKLQLKENLEWPQHFIEAASGEKYSIKVTNNSRTVTFYGWHNQQIYQFIIQHLRYLSPTTNYSSNQGTRIFKLQCFSNAGSSVVKSNVAVVKVTIWYNNYRDNYETVSAKSSSTYERVWKDLMNNITANKYYPSLYAHSNSALISEVDTDPRKSNKMAFNILLGIGLFMLMSVVIMIIRKTRRQRSYEGCLIPTRFCFPLHIIKERIMPSPSVRVELSKEFKNRVSERRRNISMEMQWDDDELKTNSGYNIIANPLYEKSVGDIDDITLNGDVPPPCEEEEMTTDDDTYQDFTELCFDRNKNGDKVKIK